MIRPMQESDLAAAMRLKQAAGWNQTEQDWLTLLAVAPQGCWVEQIEGEVAGTTSLVCYGRDLGWIGMVLTAPERRRQGVARRLVSHALATADRLGVECLKLDATEMGRPLYLDLGFVDEEPIERWGRQPDAGLAAPPATPQRFDLAAAAKFDAEAFGADRSAVLERLAAAPGAVALGGADGYVLGRPGSNAYYLGPCAAPDPGRAKTWIVEALARSAGKPIYWDLLPSQSAAAALAQELGFRPLRRLMRMARPSPRAYGRPDWVWAGAGFEYG